MKLIELWVWLLKGRQYVTMVRAVGPKEWVQQVGWFSKSCNKMAVVGLSRRAASYSGWLVYFRAETRTCGSGNENMPEWKCEHVGKDQLLEEHGGR